MFIKRRSEQPGTCVYLWIYYANDADNRAGSTKCYIEIDGCDPPVGHSDGAVWQLMTHSPAMVKRLLYRRLGNTAQLTVHRPFRTVYDRVMRVAGDIVMTASCYGDQQVGAASPMFGMHLPGGNVCHTARSDLTFPVQSIDGRAPRLCKTYMTKASLLTHAQMLISIERAEQLRAASKCDGRSGVAVGQGSAQDEMPTYTVAECNALVTESLRWRARTWIHRRPPRAGESRHEYCFAYTCSNVRRLLRCHFELVVEERYRKDYLNCKSVWIPR